MTQSLRGKERWISKDAVYRVSSVYESNVGPFVPLPGLLTGKEGPENLNGDEFAFHTAWEKSPFIVIDLGRQNQITRIVIENRRHEPQNRKELQDRAAGLRVWLSDEQQCMVGKFGRPIRWKPSGRYG